MLRARLGVPRDTALLAEFDAPYVAIKTPRGQLPAIPWTIYKVRVDPSVPKNTVEIGEQSLTKPIPIFYRAVDPVKITHVILTAPEPLYEALKDNQDSIKQQLPELVHQGDYIESLRSRVRVCEPAEQGVIDRANVTVTVVMETARSTGAPDYMDGESLEVEISHFLQNSSDNLRVETEILKRPILEQSLTPAPFPYEDLENVCLLRVDQMAKLGIFSGALITVRPILDHNDSDGDSDSDVKSRAVWVFAYPEPNTVSGKLFLPPLLAYNLGSPTEVELVAATESSPIVLDVAKDVTISRIASPVSTERTYQQAFLSGLRTYFEQSFRVVKKNDILAVPIDTALAQTFFTATPSGDEEELTLAGQPDAIAWFKITALSDHVQCIIDPSHTRMVQSGIVNEPSLPPALGWASYYGLETPFSFLDHGSDVFEYAWKVYKLLKSSLTPRGSALKTTMLLTSSKRGAGKATVLSSVAATLGIHVVPIDCFSILDESDVKTIGALKARLDRAAHISPCLVILRHLEAVAHKSDQDGTDPPIIAHVVQLLTEYIGKPFLFVTATTADADKLSDSVRTLFKFETDVTVPTEKEREIIFKYLTNAVLSPAKLVADLATLQVLEGYALQGSLSHAAMAIQSAGLTPSDLVSIIRVARQKAQTRRGNDVNLIICQRGVLKITAEDIQEAMSDARSKFSDSIGAPKIPNVGWKDVGGLENVKSEIMDTIEMPLKYPELFASGVKKRSGILFYGPPGTGKTLLAKAIATSFSLNFFSVKGPELLNMYIGESEANVRRVFQKARDAKPCVVFFDELDSVAPKRGNQGDSGGVMDRIVSQLLAELDGMSQGSDGVFVIGATNRPDLLDEALLRPGRFDKLLYLGVSDTHEKQKTIIEALTRKFKLAPDVDLAAVARVCPFSYTGADFYAMSSDAMLNAMTRTAGEVDAKIELYNREREERGELPVTIRSWFEHVATEKDTTVQVTAADFAKAQSSLVPSVSADELAHYMRVRNSFEGKAAGPKDGTKNDLKRLVNGR